MATRGSITSTASSTFISFIVSFRQFSHAFGSSFTISGVSSQPLTPALADFDLLDIIVTGDPKKTQHSSMYERVRVVSTGAFLSPCVHVSIFSRLLIHDLAFP